MEIDSSITSPNFDPLEIEVRFVVLHYTACTLERTFQLFTDRESKVSAHFVISRQGQVFEIVSALRKGVALRAWHAGVSAYRVDECEWEGLNDYSIGIELENLNGNFFAYTDRQYHALCDLLLELGRRYPSLRYPESLLGHQEIAGFRGKIDPGKLFDWKRVVKHISAEFKFQVYQPSVPREALLFKLFLILFFIPAHACKLCLHKNSALWPRLNSFLERTQSL